jgi:hypothetical protein
MAQRRRLDIAKTPALGISIGDVLRGNTIGLLLVPYFDLDRIQLTTRNDAK